MECPNCHNINPAGSRFCQYCGHDLAAASAVTNPVQAGVSRPQAGRTQQTTPLRPIAEAKKPIGQLGAGGSAAAGVWSPFAGYGTRGRHASWLLDNRGDKAGALHEAVTERFHQREIPGSNLRWETLRAKGLLVEQRPYYFVKRGITTVALYIAQFGQDLYISQVTYVKGPISNVRVAVLILMILFALFYRFIWLNVTIANAFNAVGGVFDVFGTSAGDSTGFPVFSLCILGPLWLLDIWLLGLAFIYSIYKWARERDFLAILRARPNEFQEDDTIALEKAVEETIRLSLDSVDISPTLMPPAEEYGFKRRLI